MKKLYVTYIENGVVKKAELNEQRFSELQKNSNVNELISYPTAMLMEQNYTLKVTGNVNQKQILHG